MFHLNPYETEDSWNTKVSFEWLYRENLFRHNDFCALPFCCLGAEEDMPICK
jgi:hypothetical protein